MESAQSCILGSFAAPHRRLPAPGQPKPSHQPSSAFLQLGCVLILSMDFHFCPLIICCSSNPQLGEVPVEMVFFFLNQQDFFFLLFFFTVCKLLVAKTHRSLFDLFSIYSILTHKLKKWIQIIIKPKHFAAVHYLSLNTFPHVCLETEAWEEKSEPLCSSQPGGQKWKE